MQKRKFVRIFVGLIVSVQIECTFEVVTRLKIRSYVYLKKCFTRL